jgi:hypothetical protein
MSEFFSNISAFTVFLSIAAVGFLFLLISVIFGDIFEHDFDHDVDHDLGHGGPGLFSPRIISVFITSFGGVGAIAISQGYRVLPASAFGVAAGFVLGGLVYFFARFLYSQQATSTISTADLVGRTAQVTVGIPANGIGQVRCLVGETMIDKIARSSDGGEIASNSVVKIEEIVGEGVIVSRAAATGTSVTPPK